MSTSISNHMDGDALAAALTSGIHRVLGEQELLNRINVFPVADADTGTNLSLSLGSALGPLSIPGEKHLGTMLAAVADALLDGARGNSGAIVAQFFQGMSDSAGEVTRFTTYTFGEAVSMGGEYARDALSQPREGTILSVITAFAESISHQVRSLNESDFKVVIGAALERIEEALANTPNQLEVLRKAGVVDAGAKGFVELVAGINEYLQDGTIVPMPDTSIVQEIEATPEFLDADNESQFRYCTECIVTGPEIKRRKLREAISELGDSLVFAGTKRKAKIHIHVDEPEKVFEIARAYGEVSAEKADDMHRQQHATHGKKRRFAVIVDSAADISDDDMERLDIHMVPCRVQFGEHGYLDKVGITIDEFYSELESSPHHPTTSQPSPGDFRRQYQFLASHFDDVVSINVMGGASGTFDAACLAASRTEARGEIHVIDSCNGSLGQGQLAVFAAECANAGLDVERTVAAVEELVPKTTSYIFLNDLRYAVRGGRLPKWVKTMADLLGLMPIIYTTREGNLKLSGALFGRHDRIRRFARHVARRAPSGPVEIGIGHAICEDDAKELEQQLRKLLPDIQRLRINGISPAIGVHGGPETLLVAVKPWLSAQDLARGTD